MGFRDTKQSCSSLRTIPGLFYAAPLVSLTTSSPHFCNNTVGVKKGNYKILTIAVDEK